MQTAFKNKKRILITVGSEPDGLIKIFKVLVFAV